MYARFLPHTTPRNVTESNNFYCPPPPPPPRQASSLPVGEQHVSPRVRRGVRRVSREPSRHANRQTKAATVHHPEEAEPERREYQGDSSRHTEGGWGHDEVLQV